MTTPSDAEREQKELIRGLPDTPSDSDVEDASSALDEDANNDTYEDEMKKWLSTAYEPGSTNPMKKPLTSPWGLTISNADLEKLKTGFKSKSMDDKWNLLVEDLDEDGKFSVHVFRSWLQEEVYILHVVPQRSSNVNQEDVGSASIQSIIWEGNKAGLQCDAEQAKKEAVIVARSQLGCEFETLPPYPSSVLWDPKAYKRLDVE